MIDELRIGLITDIHHGPDRGTKKGSAALSLLDKYAEWLASSRPALMVEMGDRISDVDHQTDIRQAKDVARRLSLIKTPRAHLLGNHDVHRLTIAENEDIYGVTFSSRSMVINGFHLVFWNPNVELDQGNGFSLNRESLDWLEADLKTSRHPVVIFSHVPLGGGGMIGNFYFEKAYPHHTTYSEDEAIRTVIEQSGKVILCLNGHTHWNSLNTVDGIHYVTIPSLTETFPTYPHPNEAWAELRLRQTSIEIEVHGRTPALYRLPVRIADRHWANLHKPYAPASEKPA